MNAKMNKFWMGPSETTFSEGFEDLFKVKDDYRIPAPSATVREKLDKILEGDNIEGGQFTKAKGFNEAMESVFGNWMKGKLKDDGRDLMMSPEAMIPSPMPTAKPNPSPLQVVQSGGTSSLNIVIIEPRAFEDSLEIVNHLKARKSVIVNLQYLDREVSQRVIDFVSGATLALDGSQERVGHGVFIFASINCQVETESEGIRAYKDLFAKTFG